MNERDMLREALYGANSHVHVLHALEGLDPRCAGAEIAGSPHTIFQIMRHMAYWQDISLARLRLENPTDPATADEGWAFPAGPEDESDWEASFASLAEGLRSIESLVANPEYDLDQTVDDRTRRSARAEIQMVMGHNSYHLGQIVQMRMQLESWPPPRGGDTW